jgi:membrane associated rhomboid family serine protease/Zn-finger nucleic acid-binding protein
MFICPNCKLALSRQKVDQGVFWTCPNCGGRAVTVPLLQKLLQKTFVQQLWASVRDGPGRVGRLCPACQKPMIEVRSAGPQADLLEVCRPCEFVWFDPQEYEESPPAPPAAPVPALPQKAREAMALYEVDKIAEQARSEVGDYPDNLWECVPAVFGLPVEIEEDSPGTTPLMTWMLAAAVCLISICAFASPDEAVRMFGLIPNQAWRYGGLTFVTAFFLHAGIMHLVSNMYFLLVFGDNVEDYLGRWHYALLLLAATLAGGFAHVMLDPRSDMPLLGASGGISGVLTFYALQFPHARMGFLLWFRWFSIPVWAWLAFWVLTQCVGAAQQVSGFGTVSSLGHLGGAAIGVLAWMLWRKSAGSPVFPSNAGQDLETR